jgi:hypothetical protein
MRQAAHQVAPQAQQYFPGYFNRSFTARSKITNARYIKPHGRRRTCASVLAAPDIHPRVAMRIPTARQDRVTMEICTEVPG